MTPDQNLCSKTQILSPQLEWGWRQGCSLESLSFLACYCCSVWLGTPGFPVCHYLLGFAQTHVHWVSDAIQPSHPLLPSSPPALSLSWHQGLFNELALIIRWAKYLVECLPFAKIGKPVKANRKFTEGSPFTSPGLFYMINSFLSFNSPIRKTLLYFPF